MKDAVVWLYYNSYSLPTYHTVWSPKALLQTTLIPMGMVILINLLILGRRLKYPVMDFLRGDIGRKAQKKAIRLSHRLSLPFRFGVRVFRQNRSGYLLLFFGILLSDFIALFGLMFPKMLDHYEQTVTDEAIAQHVYYLNVPPAVQNGSAADVLQWIDGTRTATPDAEEFIAYSLMNESPCKEEEVQVYGIAPDSAYVPLTLSGTNVYISSAYAEKYNLAAGDELHLKEQYSDDTYTFHISGIYPYEGALTIFMDRDACARQFGLDDIDFPLAQNDKEAMEDTLRALENLHIDHLDDVVYYLFGENPDDVPDDEKEAIDYLLKNRITDLDPYLNYQYFSGYFTNSGITDIDSSYIATDLNVPVLTSVCRQLRHSMGGFMWIMTAAAMAVYVILTYLLTKIIIEKNARSISLVKILGFSSSEILKLYLRPTFLTAVISQLIAIPLGSVLLKQMWRIVVLLEMSGWLGYTTESVQMLLLGAAGTLLFLVTAFTEYRRIQRIPVQQISAQ